MLIYTSYLSYAANNFLSKKDCAYIFEFTGPQNVFSLISSSNKFVIENFFCDISGEKPYRCTTCDKTFARGGQLSQHMVKYFSIVFSVLTTKGLCKKQVTHTGIKKYKCDFCGSKFSCLANLKIHLKVGSQVLNSFIVLQNILYCQSHLDERDFICHICSKAFYRRDALKKHISCYHENIKAFHCKICNKMFKGHLPQVRRVLFSLIL